VVDGLDCGWIRLGVGLGGGGGGVVRDPVAALNKGLAGSLTDRWWLDLNWVRGGIGDEGSDTLYRVGGVDCNRKVRGLVVDCG
jgi:hypothetical protein